MQYLLDTVYKGHEITVFKEGRQNYIVDVREDDTDGAIIAGWTEYKTPVEALSDAKKYVDNYTRSSYESRI